MPEYQGYQLVQNDNGSVTFTYTPTEIGLHKLDVKYNGTVLEGLPICIDIKAAAEGFHTTLYTGFAPDIPDEAIQSIIDSTSGENLKEPVLCEETPATEPESFPVENEQEQVNGVPAISQDVNQALAQDVAQAISEELEFSGGDAVQGNFKIEHVSAESFSEVVSVSVLEDSLPNIGSLQSAGDGSIEWSAQCLTEEDNRMDCDEEKPAQAVGPERREQMKKKPDEAADPEKCEQMKTKPDEAADPEKCEQMTTEHIDEESKNDGNDEMNNDKNAYSPETQMNTDTGGKEDTESQTHDKKHKCEDCDKSFASLKGVRTHMRKIHKNTTVGQIVKSPAGKPPYLCEVCGKSCKNRYKLKEHVICHTDERTHTCKICGSCYKRPRDLTSHMRNQHTDKDPNAASRPLYTCEVCNKMCKSKYKLAEHQICHTDTRDNICDICGNCYKRYRDLMTHLKVHDMEDKSTVMKDGIKQPFVCEVCGDSFRKMQSFREHKAIHVSTEMITCPFEGCSKTFPTRFKLNEHRRIHKPRRLHECPYCHSYFKTASSMKTHLEKHTNPNRWKCATCYKCFTTKKWLDVHIKLQHEDVDDCFICPHDTCKKSFRMKHLLDVHVKIHSTDRKYVCSVCGQAFKTPTVLNNHKRIHFKEKHHSCLYCGKSFVRKSKLTAHMCTHEHVKAEQSQHAEIKLYTIQHVHVSDVEYVKLESSEN